MIDLHCHLLSETNDGPESDYESLEMCRIARDEGVRMIVATPLWDTAHSDEPPQDFAVLQGRLERLQHAANNQPALALGFLLRYSARLPQLIERHGSALALNGGRYLLIQIPPLRLPAEIEGVWAEMEKGGYRAVIARPECSPMLRQDPALLARWLARGHCLQIDAASLSGDYGREVQRFALRCLKDYGDGVIVASNARNARDRRPTLKTVREELTKTLGAARAREVFTETPAEIINAVNVRANVSATAKRASSLRSLSAYFQRSLKPSAKSLPRSANH